MNHKLDLFFNYPNPQKHLEFTLNEPSGNTLIKTEPNSTGGTNILLCCSPEIELKGNSGTTLYPGDPFRVKLVDQEDAVKVNEWLVFDGKSCRYNISSLRVPRLTSGWQVRV